MKILFVHTSYRLKGGEDSVFATEQAMLAEQHDVLRLTYANEMGLKGAYQFLSSIWNVGAARRLEKALDEFKPDVVHIHNFHFALGPLAIRTCKKKRVPTVITLHNYRLLCPSAILQHNGEIFTTSLSESFPWTAISRKVYRNSLFQTFWLAFVTWFHKKAGTWNYPDKYILLTDFAKNLFLKSNLNLDSSKFAVKPNFVDETRVAHLPSRGIHFLFIGRLAEEKGLRVLLDAFTGTDLQLKIAGRGDLLEEVKSACKLNSNIQYLGELDKPAVLDAMSQCTALVFPSTWFEGMPMTILEAFSLGTPVIASNIGAMQTIISDGINGLHFTAGDPADLRRILVQWAKIQESERENYEANAYQTFCKKYSKAKNEAQLVEIYESVISNATLMNVNH